MCLCCSGSPGRSQVRTHISTWCVSKYNRVDLCVFVCDFTSNMLFYVWGLSYIGIGGSASAHFENVLNKSNQVAAHALTQISRPHLRTHLCTFDSHAAGWHESGQSAACFFIQMHRFSIHGACAPFLLSVTCGTRLVPLLMLAMIPAGC
jgi:hypothetical protein